MRIRRLTKWKKARLELISAVSFLADWFRELALDEE